MYAVCVLGARGGQKAASDLSGTEVTDGYEPLCG